MRCIWERSHLLSFLLALSFSGCIYSQSPHPSSALDPSANSAHQADDWLSPFGAHFAPEGDISSLAASGSPSPGFPQQPGTLQVQKKKKGNSSATTGSPGHIFWVIPAYKVDYGQNFKPLTPKEKFDEWWRGEYDPLGLGVGAFEAATLEHSSTDGFCGYGKGWGSYGQCFGSLELDSTDSSFIGDFALPVLLHQDPRYFRLGEGSFGKRVFYAISRVFITYNDSGHNVFDSSALSGTVIAAALSNLYYPPQEVGASHTMSRVAIDLGNTALYNASAEFWPDIHRELHKIF